MTMAFEPYKPEVDSSRVWVNVSCDPGLKSELTVAAKKIGISVSELGRQAFRFALDHMDKDGEG